MGACAGKIPSTITDSLPQAPVTTTITYPPATDAEIDTFVAQIKPLDLLVFRSNLTVSTVISQAEFLKTGCDAASHVEVAITKEWCSKINLGVDNKTLLSWGSTLSNGDVSDGAFLGVQIRNMRNLVADYLKRPGANIGICRIINNPIDKLASETDTAYKTRTAALKTQLELAYDTCNGMTYDINPLSLAAALFPSLRPLRDATNDIVGKFVSVNKWMMCSGFAATLYKFVGVINDKTDGVADGKVLDPKNVVPVDFLGYDADKNGTGIAVPICELPPKWIRPPVPSMMSLI